MSNPSKIVLTRHGQTDFNVEGKIQDPINPHLTEKGKEQAYELKLKLKSLNIKPDLVICADATRNVETLNIVFSDYKNINNVKIDKRLQERYHKDLVGKTKSDIESILNIKFTNRLSWELYFEGSEKSVLTNKFPNDESLSSVDQRVVSLVKDFPTEGTIILLGSSIINQYLIMQDRLEIDFQENNELRILEFSIDKKLNYTSIYY